MSKETVEMMIEGGKAVANAAIGQKLGPLRVNIQDILKKINDKTADLKGMKVPVKIIVDKDTKEVDLEIGTPPAAELIKKEAGLQKGSGKPDKEKVANLAIEDVIKIAKMKQETLMTNSLKSAVKTIAGSCNALGILVEGKTGREINQEIEKGKYDKEIGEGKTSVTHEKKQQLKEQLQTVQQELQKLLAKEAAEAEKLAEKKEVKEEEKKPEEVKEEKGKAATAKAPEKKEEAKPKAEEKGKKK